MFVVNVDWYFSLHWSQRAIAASNAGFHVTIVANCSGGAADPKLAEAGVEWVHWPVSRYSVSFRQLRLEYLELSAILLRLRPAIVHSITIKPNVLCGIYSRLNGRSVKFIQTYPGMGNLLVRHTTLGWMKALLVTSVLRWTCRVADAFTFENNEDAQYFQRRVTSRVTPILVSRGAGVDLEHYSYRQNSLAPGESLRILHAARLLKTKGLPALVQAVVQLRKKGFLIELHAAGIPEPEASDSISSEWIFRNEADGHFVFLGQISDMPELISQYHVVALPTNYGEGIPRVLIEAAAMGRAVITTNVAGCRELVVDGETGILAANACPDSVASAIMRLLEEPGLLGRLGERARKKVENGFDEKTVVSQFIGLYREVAPKRL